MNRRQSWHRVEMFYQSRHNYINARLITVYNLFPYKCISPGERGVTHNIHIHNVECVEQLKLNSHRQKDRPACIYIKHFHMKCKNVKRVRKQFSLTHTHISPVLYMYFNVKWKSLNLVESDLTLTFQTVISHSSNIRFKLCVLHMCMWHVSIYSTIIFVLLRWRIRRAAAVSKWNTALCRET